MTLLKAPLVSVIIPARNARHHLDQILACLLAQTFQPVEIIVVVDYSHDGTAQRTREWQVKAPIIQLIETQVAVGSGFARNIGLARAKGEYIWFVDADDFVEPDYLAGLVRGISDPDGERADIVVGRASVCTEDGLPVDFIGGPETHSSNGFVALHYLLRGEITGHTWNKLFAAQAMSEAPFLNLPTHQDLAFLLDLVPTVNHVHYVNVSSYHYIRHADSTLHSPTRKVGSLLEIAGRVVERSQSSEWPQIPACDVNFFIGANCMIEVQRDIARLPPKARKEASLVLREAGDLLSRPRLLRDLLQHSPAHAFELLLIKMGGPAHRVFYNCARTVRRRWIKCRGIRRHQHYLGGRPAKFSP